MRHPDGTEAGLLGGVLRNGLDLYANVRPVELLPGIESCLRNAVIDYVIVRENTEGRAGSRQPARPGRPKAEVDGRPKTEE